MELERSQPGGNDSLQIRRWVWIRLSSKYLAGVGYKRTVDTALNTTGTTDSGLVSRIVKPSWGQQLARRVN